MTPNRAKDILINSIDVSLISSGVITYCVDLINRDIPMKVKEIHCDEYYCPACGAENTCDQFEIYEKFCPCCGQRIETEETY